MKKWLKSYRLEFMDDPFFFPYDDESFSFLKSCVRHVIFMCILRVSYHCLIILLLYP